MSHFWVFFFVFLKNKTKISADSVIYKIGFSQTKHESRHRVRTHMKMQDHKVATPLGILEGQA